VLAAAVIFGFAIWVISREFWDWQSVLKDHFAAIIGLPGAAGVAFVLVIFLRQTEGPIEFEGLGFKFKGAAGQVVLWVLCFLAIAGAIKLLWYASTDSEYRSTVLAPHWLGGTFRCTGGKYSLSNRRVHH
jgi:hypothetical protein